MTQHDQLRIADNLRIVRALYKKHHGDRVLARIDWNHKVERFGERGAKERVQGKRHGDG